MPVDIIYLREACSVTPFTFWKCAMRWLWVWRLVEDSAFCFCYSVTKSCMTICNSTDCSTQVPLSSSISWSLLKFMSIESMKPSIHLILCHPLLLLPSIFSSIPSFPKSQFFESGGQSIGASASASVLPMNIQGWFLLGLTGLIFLLFKVLTGVLQHHSLKVSILWQSAFFIVQLSHLYMTTGKTIGLTIWTFVSKVISQLFNVLSRFAIAFLPRSKCLLISWLQSSSAVGLEPNKIKSVTASTFSPSTCHEVMEQDSMILVFWMLSFISVFSLFCFTLIKRLFSSSLLFAIREVSSTYLSLLLGSFSCSRLGVH